MVHGILIFLIAIVVISILGIIITTVLRRWLQGRRFSRLDLLKIGYKERLGTALPNDSIMLAALRQEIESDSLRFEALEETLYLHYNNSIYFLNTIEALGYIEKYEAILLSNAPSQKKALAANRIGRFRHVGSVYLLEKCAETSFKNAELINAVFKSLAQIGTVEALESIITLLPNALRNHSISQKNAEMVLLIFSSNHLEFLLQAYEKYQNTQEKEAQLVMLDVISRSIPTTQSIGYCLDIIHNDDAELCVRALRHLSNVPIENSFELSVVVKLLNHSKWFIRVQAINVLKHRLPLEEILKYLFLLGDSAWQVRRNFAELLVSHKVKALAIIVNIINGNDNYAKEAIAEAILMEDFFPELLEYVTLESAHYDFAKIILRYLKEIKLINLEHNINMQSYPELTQQTITKILAEKEGDNA